MKTNENNLKMKNYYVGLDVGTNSVGFAATDEMYNLKKHSGKAIWGVRLFDEGETAQTRRLNRTNRRRLSRRNSRLNLLEMLFDEEISKIDRCFFMRLKESFLHIQDRKSGCKYSLFADDGFTDKEYMKKYPTIYHLRKELVESNEPHDIRLVFLAIRHILKNRGHFLFNVDNENNLGFDTVYSDFLLTLNEMKEISLDISSNVAYEIINKKASKSDRIKEIVSLLKLEKDDKKAVEKLFSLIIGGTAKMTDIFASGSSQSSLSFDMGDDKMFEVADEVGKDFDLILSAKAIYDCLILEKITKGFKNISDYKISEYEQHKEDIKLLKGFVRTTLCNKTLYDEIFNVRKEKLTNYASYSGYRKGDSKCSCTQQEFCKFLKDKLPQEYSEKDDFKEMYRRINEGIFAPKQRKTENGVIPNSLHRSELVAILNNASSYLNFLNKADENGITVKEKIISLFDFKLPYYVGPLKNGWAVRKEEGTIYPWNFEDKINLEESVEKFIMRMTARCTYTGDYVLPKNSLLYSEFEVLNEINNIKINSEPISVSCKKMIYEKLFVQSNKKVTKKAIENLLRKEGLLKSEDVVSGIDDTVKSQLVSYHKLRRIIEKTSYEKTEDIIRNIVLFGDDKKILRKYIEEKTNLSREDVDYLLKQRFNDWGRLSKRLLTEFLSVNKETGEAMSIIEMMRETNNNFMKLLTNNYDYNEQAEEYRKQTLGINGTPFEMVNELYVSPKIRRSVWQTLKILDEIVDIEKGAPEKIFIEVARETESDDKKKKNEASRRSRKEQLINWYKECKQNVGELFDGLNKESEERLHSKKLYLYYLQFGKCMYSGEPIEIAELDRNSKYDIDHIFPRSKIKDDSFDNLVLVKAELNREKTNKYPISDTIRTKMVGFWSLLKDRGTISLKKYERLVRCTPLTEEELASFVNRQLVETRQSTKAIAELIKVIYPKTKIVYSKAGNVSDFRKYYEFEKCRDINDYHHAKDAYLNVVVGNYFDVKFTSAFIKNILTEEYSLNVETLYNRTVNGAWQSGENGTITTVRKVMEKNNILFTVMPKEEHGQLYKVTIKKKGEGQVPIKKGLEINKYGGYDKAAGAYFAIVEHFEKGKSVRTIEAVLKYQKVEYEKNPELFAKNNWYNDAKIIYEKILFNSVLEIDGIRLSIRKRQNEQIGFVHMYQFILKGDNHTYVKKICKFTEELSINKNAVLPKNISKERNVEIYDMFISRMNGTVYGRLFGTVENYLTNNREKFIDMDEKNQCLVLKEILKSFKCNPALTSLSLLCGKGNVGSILKNKKISELKSVYLIHQSVTGIFETKTDLL